MTRPTNGTLNKILVSVLAAALTIVIGWWQSALVSRVDASERAAAAATEKATQVERENALLKSALAGLIDQNGKDHQRISQQLDRLITMHMKGEVK